MAAISDLYDDALIGSSPAGVMAGKKDEDFQKALATGFAHNRKIGAQRMEVVDLRHEKIVKIVSVRARGVISGGD